MLQAGILPQFSLLSPCQKKRSCVMTAGSFLLAFYSVNEQPALDFYSEPKSEGS